MTFEWEENRWTVPVDRRGDRLLWQGDILLGDARREQSAEEAEEVGKSQSLLAAVPSSRRWPGGRVPFLITDDVVAPEAVIEAMVAYHRFTNLRFVPRAAEQTFLRIQNKEEGCWSNLGMTDRNRNGGPVELNLGDDCNSVDTAIHELGHAIGAFHEQERADRDGYVRILWDNIEDGKAHNFVRYTDDGVEGQDIGPYDFASILHYGPFEFSKNNKPTIERIDGLPFPEQKGLSEHDIESLNTLYPEAPSGPRTFCVLRHRNCTAGGLSTTFDDATSRETCLGRAVEASVTCKNGFGLETTATWYGEDGKVAGELTYYPDDRDGDNVHDDVDNCVDGPNREQEDDDEDGSGDVCDPCPHDPHDDADEDGICGDEDVCPMMHNPEQLDSDGDQRGDLCDPCPNDVLNDIDEDGACGMVDVCPALADPEQTDTDGDGLGDACERCGDDPANDRDGDLVCAGMDVCPDDFDPGQEDTDGDGMGDACDPCPATAGGVRDAEGTCTPPPSDDGGCSAGGAPDGSWLSGLLLAWGALRRRRKSRRRPRPGTPRRNLRTTLAAAVTLALALVLVGCGDDDAHTAGDAGTGGIDGGQDAGGDSDAGHAPSPIGGPCSTDADCEEGACLASEDGFTGGLCALRCDEQELTCPTGTLCATVNKYTREAYCLPDCSSEDTCRDDGYACTEVNEGQVCWRAGTGDGVLDTMCETDADCAGGAGAFCDRVDPGGRCTRECSVPSDCPATATCTRLGLCRTECETAADCAREDYGCYPQYVNRDRSEPFSCEPLGTGDGALGDPCESNVDCAGAALGLCDKDLLRCSQLCDDATPCPEGHTCSLGQCYASCTVDDDCHSPDEFCSSAGTCVPPAEGRGLPGDPCRFRTHCTGGRRGTCRTHSDEGLGYRDGSCVVYCEDEAGCPGDTTCSRFGQCVRPCDDSTDCREGYVCLEVQEPYRDYCLPGAFGDRPVGDLCEEHWQCMGGAEGLCADAICTLRCEDESVCPGGYHCVVGACRRDCTRESDCNTEVGQVCADGDNDGQRECYVPVGRG